MAMLARMTRSSMIEDAERRLHPHCASQGSAHLEGRLQTRAAQCPLLPVITVAGMQFMRCWLAQWSPKRSRAAGLGHAALEGIAARDYRIVQGARWSSQACTWR